VETTKRCYRVDRRQISFVKFILEAYDNMAVMSTLDPRQAVVQVTIAPGCEAMVGGIMASLAGDVEVVPVDGAGADGVTTDNCTWPAAGNG
jgi:ethanolamine utilization microcompartment shell protein EutS